jgi:hypothetical protein
LALFLVGGLGCALPTKIGELADTDTSASETEGTESQTSTVGGETEGGSSNSSGESEGNTDTDDPIEPGPQRSFAITFGEIPPPSGGTGTSTSTTGGGGPPDDALLVSITTGIASCTDVYNSRPCSSWSVSFTLPIELQTPGTYDLEELNGFYSVSFGEDDGFDGCTEGGGGGSLLGTVIIEEIDDASVVGRIENADAFDFDANVSFVAERC